MRNGMRFLAALFTVALAGGGGLLAAPTAKAQDCGESTVIASGDSLSSIAARCGVTVDEIMAVNPLLPSPRFVFPGLRINLPPPPAAPLPSRDVFRYVVRPGDTLFGIARANDVTLPDIYRLNPNIDASSLRVGDTVLLPGRGSRPEAPHTVRYTVRSGDTLRSIARDYDIAVQDILQLNPDVDPRDLRAGDVLILPAGAVAGRQPPPPSSAPPAANTNRYVVRPGDTLFSIARANGVTMSSILELNPNINANSLRVGDVIVLRGGIVPPPAQQSSAFVTIKPESGTPGTVVRLDATGFRPSTKLRALAGTDAGSLREFQQVTTDRDGHAGLDVPVPESAASRGTLVFAFETLDRRVRVLSQTFRVTSRAPGTEPGQLTIVGTVTREGVECPAMRGEDGRLYTLTGRLSEDVRAGDRVRVVGRDVLSSSCQQGTTIRVQGLTRLN